MEAAGIVVCRPTVISESESIALKLKDGNPVLLDLEQLTPEDRVRVSDYLRGAAMVLGVTVRVINPCQMLMLAPGQDGGVVELTD